MASRAPVSAGGIVEAPVEFVGEVDVVERGRVGVVAQGCCGVSVPEPGLCLEEMTVFDERRGHRMPEAVQRGVAAQPGAVTEPDEPVGQQAGSGVDRPPVVGGEHPVVDHFVRTRASQVSKWSRIIAAVVAPIVMRLVRFDLVGLRSTVSTRPSRSDRRNVASSPRRAPVSAASRTRSRFCSATNSCCHPIRRAGSSRQGSSGGGELGIRGHAAARRCRPCGGAGGAGDMAVPSSVRSG